MSSEVIADPAFSPSRTAHKDSPVVARSRWIGRLWGIWLVLFSLASFTLRPPPIRDTINFDQFRDPGPKLAAALLILALASVVPALWSAMILGLDFRRAKFFAPAVFIMCVSIPISFLALSDPKLMVYLILVYTMIGCAVISISTNADQEVMLGSLFVTVAWTQTLMMVWVLKDHDYSWGRLFGRVQPNYWGAVAQLVIIGSVAMRGWVLRAGAVAISLVILYETQSRGSEVAVAAGMVVAFVLYTLRSRWRAVLWLGAALGLVFVLLLGSNFILNDLMKADDPARGAGSGLTGRASAWAETMTLITNHPWVGVGYRQHEQYLTTEASAHNAYLATLADTGVIGFFGYMLFLVGGLWRAVLKALDRPSGAALASAAFLAAFLVNGMFERTALNTGNSYSLLMILVAAWAWRKDDPQESA